MFKRAEIIGAAIGVAMCLPATASASSKPNPKAELLSISAMPAGWSTTANVKSTAKGCGKVSPLLKPHSTGSAEASFEVNGEVPLYQEYVFAYPTTAKAKTAWTAVSTELNACSTFKSSSATITVGKMSFPAMGTRSGAWTFSATADGTTIAEDILIAEKSSQVVATAYGAIGRPPLSTVESLDKAAVAKA
jgi:hypothetical protein